MTIDLWMLLAAAGLQWVLIMVAAGPQLLGNGMAWAAGNRDETPKADGWVARAKRADKNLQENLPLFAILVLVAHVSDTADAMTGYGAMTFVGARAAHALSYWVGIPYLRTGMWMISIAGMGLIVYGIVA